MYYCLSCILFLSVSLILNLFFAESLCFLCRKIWLYPKGNEKNRGCNISIFLVSVDSKDFDHHRKVKANYSFCIKDQIGGECDKRLSSKITPPTFILMVLVFICYLVNFLRLSLILSFFFACNFFL